MVSLETSKPFRNLSAAELTALRQLAQEKNFSAGQQIFKEGDAGDGVYIIKDGQVEISVMVNPTVRRVFAQLNPGEMFGEMAVLELKPRSATAIASKDTVAYFIPRGELLGLVERSPVLSLELLREISQRLRDFNRRYVEEMLQAERLSVVGRFARSIIHDIKNPLSIISMTAEMAGMANASAEMRDQAQLRISKQVERISELIGEILDFTHGSNSEFVLASADYSTFVQQLVDELRADAGLRDVQLEVQGALPTVTISLDPKRLRRVFYNLVHNATDAMPNGGKVFLRVQIKGNEVVTEIEDTGPGIAPEIAGKLFEAFATFGKEHGSGLGLSICKKIVEDHHGRIWARNEPRRGAVFAFTLPLAQQSLNR
jgi:signal transduction histidine kinase